MFEENILMTDFSYTLSTELILLFQDKEGKLLVTLFEG